MQLNAIDDDDGGGNKLNCVVPRPPRPITTITPVATCGIAHHFDVESPYGSKINIYTVIDQPVRRV